MSLSFNLIYIGLSFNLIYIGLSLYLIYIGLSFHFVVISPSVFPCIEESSEIAYLYIFRVFFSAVLKEPNLRFESAHLTSSFGLFDELIWAL